ncbi:hypothetical protein WMF26_06890 [Sorangium sp. So ce185]|uniref:hypothetical protein n=1 Tax=Sorangium sp. So ce185 TaxID=3133287 RepID=UPI003F6429BA
MSQEEATRASTVTLFGGRALPAAAAELDASAVALAAAAEALAAVARVLRGELSPPRIGAAPGRHRAGDSGAEPPRTGARSWRSSSAR